MKETVCPYCETKIVNDKGNYMCWPCEDGNLLPNFWFQRVIRRFVGNRKYHKFRWGQTKFKFYKIFLTIYRLLDRDIWRYV